MDPFAIPKFVALCVRAAVARFGWKLVVAGWIISVLAAVVLQHTI